MYDTNTCTQRFANVYKHKLAAHTPVIACLLAQRCVPTAIPLTFYSVAYSYRLAVDNSTVYIPYELSTAEGVRYFHNMNTTSVEVFHNY